jgi:hypothetical protein
MADLLEADFFPVTRGGIAAVGMGVEEREGINSRGKLVS